MNSRTVSITPPRQAVNGAMDIFVDGHRKDDVRQMLFGLSVLSSSTETQVEESMRSVQAHGRATIPEIEAMPAR